MSARRFRPPSECPVCGAEVPPNARACPECGADERTGWNDEATRYDGLDLPESAFEESDAGETSPDSSRKKLTRTGVPVFTWLIAVVVLLAIVALIVRGRF
jgi:hypothetical protein